MADEIWQGPNTHEEWQRAASAASALLVIEALQIPQPDQVEIDRERCEDVLKRARERNIEPRPNALGRYVAERAAKGVPARPDDDLRGIVPS